MLTGLRWAIYAHWVMLTWDPRKHGSREYTNLIAAAVAAARQRLARKERQR